MVDPTSNTNTGVPNGANTQYTGGLDYGYNPYMYGGQGNYSGYGVMGGYQGYGMPYGYGGQGNPGYGGYNSGYGGYGGTRNSSGTGSLIDQIVARLSAAMPEQKDYSSEFAALQKQYNDLITKNNANVTTPDPKVTTPDPKVTTPDPNVTTPDPKITTPDPKIIVQPPQPKLPIGPTTPTDPNIALITSAYQKDFGRAPDATGLAYYQQQLAQHPEFANNLNAIIGGGAAAGSADYNFYKSNTPPTIHGNPAPGIRSDGSLELLNSIYTSDFGRAYNPATDSYWANQLASNPSLANDPIKLQNIIGGGAAAGSDDYVTYMEKIMNQGAGGGTATPTEMGGNKGSFGPVGSDGDSDLLNSIYTSDFGRAYNPATDSYWANQLASNPSLANDPTKLQNMIGGGASSGSSDANYYNKAMTVNPVTVGGQTYNPVVPSGTNNPGYIANLNAANANPQIASALAGAVNAGIPGFNVVKTGGRIKYKY